MMEDVKNFHLFLSHPISFSYLCTAFYAMQRK